MTVPSSESEHTPTSSGVETTPPLEAGFACRFCRHDIRMHNRMVGCQHCRCAGTPGEGLPRTGAELDITPLPPGSYLKDWQRPLTQTRETGAQLSPLDDAEHRLLRAGQVAGAALNDAWDRESRTYSLTSNQIGDLLHSIINHQSMALNAVRQAKRRAQENYR